MQKKLRCSKCSREQYDIYVYEQYDKIAKPMCCNFGCEVSKRATGVQKMKVIQGISYSEAVEKVTELKKLINEKNVNSYVILL